MGHAPYGCVLRHVDIPNVCGVGDSDVHQTVHTVARVTWGVLVAWTNRHFRCVPSVDVAYVFLRNSAHLPASDLQQRFDKSFIQAGWCPPPVVRASHNGDIDDLLKRNLRKTVQERARHTSGRIGLILLSSDGDYVSTLDELYRDIGSRLEVHVVGGKAQRPSRHYERRNWIAVHSWHKVVEAPVSL